jgi:hypothetical protein
LEPGADALEAPPRRKLFASSGRGGEKAARVSGGISTHERSMVASRIERALRKADGL